MCSSRSLLQHQVEVHSPPQVAGSVRARSPSLPPPQVAGSVHARSPSPPLRSLRIRSNSPRREPEKWERPDLPRYTSGELNDWQNSIRSKVLDDYSLSVKDAAQLPSALTHLVRYILMGGVAADYVAESSDVYCKIKSSNALLSPAIRIEV
jgi:hypothetical protein